MRRVKVDVATDRLGRAVTIEPGATYVIRVRNTEGLTLDDATAIGTEVERWGEVTGAHFLVIWGDNIDLIRDDDQATA